jgi:superfamily I DNA and/or RNA helicase
MTKILLFGNNNPNAMETITTTLTVRICGAIETPPATNREDFRQSVIDTVLQVMKTTDASIEYIGYQPDRTGIHHLEGFATEFEDCVYVSFNVATKSFAEPENLPSKTRRDLVDTFVEMFENRTHRHLEVDSTFISNGQRNRIIEMRSDWNHYLRHG